MKVSLKCLQALKLYIFTLKWWGDSLFVHRNELCPWNSCNRKTETYCSSVTRVAISHVYASVDSIFYLREKQVRSRSALTKSLKEKEKFGRVIVPRLLRRAIEIAGTSRVVPNEISKSSEVEIFLVRGKLSQTVDWRKVIAKIHFPHADLFE